MYIGRIAGEYQVYVRALHILQYKLTDISHIYPLGYPAGLLGNIKCMYAHCIFCSTYKSKYVYIHMCVCIFSYMYVHEYVCVKICVYMYIGIHI